MVIAEKNGKEVGGMAVGKSSEKQGCAVRGAVVTALQKLRSAGEAKGNP